MSGHGTRSTYRKGCRCGDCREANNAYARLTSARTRAKRRTQRPRTDCVTPGCRNRYKIDGRCSACARRMASHGDPTIAFDDLPWRSRIIAAVERTEGGCWTWIKALNHGGYGVTWNGEHTILAHRLSYIEFVGPIPDGLHIDHLCRNRACVNPEHLEAVTQAENNYRADVRNRT